MHEMLIKTLIYNVELNNVWLGIGYDYKLYFPRDLVDNDNTTTNIINK